VTVVADTATTTEVFGDVVVYANNSALVMGQVTIQGEAAEVGDVVAIYVGNELRGKQAVLVNAGAAWLSNAVVNAKGGEETISFKVWDASTGVTHEKGNSSAVINPGEAVGTYASPFMIEMKDSETQTLSLNAGWNLVSFYVEPTDMTAATVFAPISSSLLQIKNLQSSYDPNLPFFWNTLSTMVPGSGYWLKVTADGTWTVGTVSEGGSGRGLGKMGPVQKMGWGRVVIYPNLSATVLSEVSVGGKPVSEGSVVGVFVGEELRAEQEVVLANGRSYATLNVNLTGRERVTYRIREAASGKEYRVARVMELGLGETYGRVEELVKLNAVMTGSGVSILSYTRSPFGFEFESEAGKSYVVEATVDLSEWKPVQTLEGTGKRTWYTPDLQSKTAIRYFRIKTQQ
jgi:hypothetical protein